MINIKPIFLILLFPLYVTSIQAQVTSKYERKMFFPDLDNYKTLLTDFHQHTVFSDGKVWPSIRVEEAIKDGLDAISLTDHLEYQPHSQDIENPDRNRVYIIASQFAERQNKNLEKKLIVINGQEITRSMPPGHINAIFINDANKLLHENDSLKGIEEANNKTLLFFGIIQHGLPKEVMELQN